MQIQFELSIKIYIVSAIRLYVNRTLTLKLKSEEIKLNKWDYLLHKSQWEKLGLKKTVTF